LTDHVTVKEKHIEKIMTGTYQMPGHYLSFMITFQTSSDNVLYLSVPKETFDNISVGVQGKLITQNQNFIGFELDQ
jgi:hypothetical protein